MMLQQPTTYALGQIDKVLAGAKGTLPDSLIHALASAGDISANAPLVEKQFQPASLDLRLGPTAYRIRASFLPGPNCTVRDRLKKLCLHEFSIADGAVLETGCVYLVPLEERLNLRPGIKAFANPKSSTGRLDVFTRLICDDGRAFDEVPDGYNGELFAEISPRTFSILVRRGSKLNQLRFRIGEPYLSDAEILDLNDESPLVDADIVVKSGLALRVRLREQSGTVIGYRAKKHSGIIDLDRVGAYDVEEFWDPIIVARNYDLVLDPNEFYILASEEALSIPSNLAAEMVPFDPMMGEFRVHYAGFFDPGFGQSVNGKGSRAVLEVRSHEVPFVLEHNQVIGRLAFERLCQEPQRPYGSSLASNYQGQGLKLGKHFRG